MRVSSDCVRKGLAAAEPARLIGEARMLITMIYHTNKYMEFCLRHLPILEMQFFYMALFQTYQTSFRAHAVSNMFISQNDFLTDP